MWVVNNGLFRYRLRNTAGDRYRLRGMDLAARLAKPADIA